MSDIVYRLYIHLDPPVDTLSLAINLPPDTGDLTEIKDLIMATKEEILASIDTVKTTLTELSKDVTRIIGILNAAIAAADLTAVADGVAELSTLATAIDDAVEAASPEA